MSLQQSTSKVAGYDRFGWLDMERFLQLHNEEIQNKNKREKYKSKFIQYTNATNACLSVFWIFDVHKKGSDVAKFNDLRVEYKDLDNTLLLLTDCKCSSGTETGLPKTKQEKLKTVKNGNINRRKKDKK